MSVGPFLCDQRPIPPYKRIRRDQRVEFAEHLATQGMRSARESTAFGICESKASAAKSLFQQSVLFREVLDHLGLFGD